MDQVRQHPESKEMIFGDFDFTGLGLWGRVQGGDVGADEGFLAGVEIG